MKETPIIMSGNHPKLIQDKLKTMTRRTYGLEEINKEPDRWEYMRTQKDGSFLFWVVANDPELDVEKRVKLIKCPYGQVGDRLWVRETWKEYNCTGLIAYKADGDLHTGFPWKPSIHMFRKDSRITLEITEVRAERVQEISDSDIAKEGIDVTFHEKGKFGIENPCATGVVDLPKGDRMYTTARGCMIALWDSLNAKRGYSFDFNPWVWPISFKKILDGGGVACQK